MDESRKHRKKNPESGAGDGLQRDIIKMVSGLKPPFPESGEESWEKFRNKIEKGDGDNLSERWLNAGRILVYAVAASILLFIVFFTAGQLSQKKVTVPRGTRQTVFLPDSSKVVLNADSEMSYSRWLWNFRRSVKLRGEAFFVVRKGKKFSVICNPGEVMVKGTSFNVFSRKDAFEVKCLEGMVLVDVPENHAVTLKAEEAVRYDPESGRQTVYSFNAGKAGSWMRGEFIFEHAPLEMVFHELERQFDIRILYSGAAAGRKYTGSFNNRNLQSALDLVCVPMGLKYTFLDEHTIQIN